MSILGQVSHENTLGQLFEERVAATPDAVAYVEYSHVLGKWFRHSWESVHEQAGRAQSLLKALGLEAGDRIGIMAHGGTYWVTLDLAAVGLGDCDRAAVPSGPGRQCRLRGRTQPHARIVHRRACAMAGTRKRACPHARCRNISSVRSGSRIRKSDRFPWNFPTSPHRHTR